MFTQIYVNANYPRRCWPTARGSTPSSRGAGAFRSSPRSSARHLALHPPADAGEPGLQEDEGGRLAVEGAAVGRFGQWKNAKIALLALLGLVAGQAVVWYTGQFYALFFLQSILKIDNFTANVLIAWALVIGTWGFLIFGALSDRIGRKPIILLGCVLAALTYFPLFKMLVATANPALAAAQKDAGGRLADPNDCSFQFNPTGTAKFTNSCDIAKATLARNSVSYTTEPAPAGSVAKVKVGDVIVDSYDADQTLRRGGQGGAGRLHQVDQRGADEGRLSARRQPDQVKIPIDPKAGLSNFAQMFDVFSAQS